jgi:hypothetical protein
MDGIFLAFRVIFYPFLGLLAILIDKMLFLLRAI